MTTSTPQTVQLRQVREEDLEHFFAHQADPEATRVASFPSRERGAFFTHWHQLLEDPSVFVRTIVLDGAAIAGNLVCWGPRKQRLVGYWVGREFWGRGFATAGLRAFLPLLEPPVFAHVARSNPRSIRVLEKAGFTLDRELDDLIFTYRKPLR
jgi:RimJ/RimL family protein N-acetyltransferase